MTKQSPGAPNRLGSGLQEACPVCWRLLGKLGPQAWEGAGLPWQQELLPRSGPGSLVAAHGVWAFLGPL